MARRNTLILQLSRVPHFGRTIPLGGHPLARQACSGVSLSLHERTLRSQCLHVSQWISWICGWFAVSGWIALVATAGSLAGDLITGAIGLANSGYSVERWHIFLIYLAYMLGACVLNIFGLRLLPTIDRTAIFW